MSDESDRIDELSRRVRDLEKTVFGKSFDSSAKKFCDHFKDHLVYGDGSVFCSKCAIWLVLKKKRMKNLE